MAIYPARYSKVFVCAIVAWFGSRALAQSPLGPRSVERIGPPTLYSAPVERYRFGEPNMSDSAFYPVPQDRITRESYLRAIDEMKPEEIAAKPEQGMDGPRAFVPVLVKYVETRDVKWADACVAMLKAFHAEMERQVAERKWFWQFEHPAALVPLYRKYLIEGGALTTNAPWFRELWLYYCRHLHVWDSEPVEWRGGCHRSMPEAYAKGRAAAWYPDIPEAHEWARYSELVFGDFWTAKDVAQNDTGYMMGPIIMLTCGADQWTGDDRAYVDPGVKRLWDRLLVEVSPDGAINPYGPNGGWNSTADYRLAMLERIASKTGDGRYRFAAHKLFNYLRYQSRDTGDSGYRVAPGSGWLVALAWLFADDSIAPVQPDADSLWGLRMEAARIPHTDKALTERLMGNADPRENYGHVCCSWFMTGKEWPDKLALRSGWAPGSLFALVELHPTSFPPNPGGIMGLDRWGAPFTQIVTSKGDSVENRALIEDAGGAATRRFHPDALRIDAHWRSGTMPDIRSEVTYFEDTPSATFARLRVQNMDGLPVVYEREFVFAKDRFLASRETVTFEEAFSARVAPLWNTRNIGPQIGAHWANTFLGPPVGDNGAIDMKAPPADLLVWFAPRADCTLQVVDRLADDPRAEACPAQVRYLWENTATPGQQVVFTQVYYPHAPYRSRASTNNPGATAVYHDELQATAGAAGIQVVHDDVNVTILRVEMQAGIVEWIAFNPSCAQIALGPYQSRDPYVYRVAR